nr:immunoglobulin light chain junction region [Macaca mulatta]
CSAWDSSMSTHLF